MKKYIIAFLLLSAFAASSIAAKPKWLPATAEKLPRWRGFNLLEKFYKRRTNGPFKEEDFKLISELGFNFVRLPMDYRIWIKDGDWTTFDEAFFKDLDQTVAWGEKYGIHVCMNFHRAPGYTVANPKEKTDLWTDPQTQKICAMHWAFFAKRYKGIPSERLSFNLFNEPSGIDAKKHEHVVKIMVTAIRAQDPGRLIIADGRQWGKEPCMELLPLKVAQATRGYAPTEISHYKASWMHGADQMPLPSWPLPKTTGFLYGPGKKDLRKPLRLQGTFSQPTRLRIRLGTVSNKGKIVAKADGKVIWERAFTSGPGKGEWKTVVHKPQWNVYQNIFDRDYDMAIPLGTKVVEVDNTDGDWLTLTEIGLKPAKGNTPESVLGLSNQYGDTQEPIGVVESVGRWQFKTRVVKDQAWLWKENIEPWQKARTQGIGVMVGEWGAYNKTPHDVVLRWAEDSLKNWQKAGIGWALWNFRGSFGILDSERTDVAYEQWRGHKLDRKFLELLQKY